MNVFEKFEKVKITEKIGSETIISNGIIVEALPHSNIIIKEDGKEVELTESDFVKIDSLGEKMKTIDLKFSKLTGLTDIDLVSTMLKITEETGELSRAINNYNSNSTNEAIDKMKSELLDVAQTAITMMDILDSKFKTTVIDNMDAHCKKLIKKGYIK